MQEVELEILVEILNKDSGTKKNPWIGVGRGRTQLLDNLRKKRRYWERTEELKIEKGGKEQFITRT